jgi:hypothetical protein
MKKTDAIEKFVVLFTAFCTKKTIPTGNLDGMRAALLKNNTTKEILICSKVFENEVKNA